MTVKNFDRLMIPSDSLCPAFREAARASRRFSSRLCGLNPLCAVIRSTSVGGETDQPYRAATKRGVPGGLRPQDRVDSGIALGAAGAPRQAYSASEPRRKHESPDSQFESGADPRSFDRNGPLLVSPYLPRRPHTAGIG
jgi:hypothetical protein